MKPNFVPICNKCGKRQEIDSTKSNDNWKVYPNVPCKCGGEYKLELRPIEV